MVSEEERRKQHRHQYKQRVLRGIPDELADDFDAATRSAGSDRSNITKRLWEWYVRRPGVELPERPTAPEPPDDAT
ncbi:hypothetical protein ACFVAF_25055 [Streptomyces sp. NPDC057596]|uniref:hypothetical protein n=1 Tax=Streptomyces sp. NPDC057596 TaxID=3346178 RepID=UPI00368A8BE4